MVVAMQWFQGIVYQNEDELGNRAIAKLFPNLKNVQIVKTLTFTMMKSLIQQLRGKPESVSKQGLKVLAHVVHYKPSPGIQIITWIYKHKVSVGIHPP